MTLSLTTTDKNSAVLVNANLEILGQLSVAIDGFSEEAYTHKANEAAPIGMHVRHILEFYQAFLKTVDENRNSDICYDNRQRDLDLETSKESAAQALNVIKSAFMRLPVENTDLILSVIVMPSQPLIPIPTTLHRELYHVLDHMIHHMALIKLIATMQGIALDENFGLARSTQDHQRTLK